MHSISIYTIRSMNPYLFLNSIFTCPTLSLSVFFVTIRVLRSNLTFFFVPGGKSTAGFVERCVSYIGENATECVRTNSFLSLPKEAIIKLISSDYVSVNNNFTKRSSIKRLIISHSFVWTKKTFGGRF